MPDHPFVGRDRELHKLEGFLEKAQAGSAQTVFIAGEAGAGKSALVNEFVRRAEDADAKVITAIGECNAQTGVGDAYLPFRQLLTTLTGTGPEEQPAQGASPTSATRLKELARVSGQTLLDVGPDLIGIFVPGASLIVKVATRAATHGKLMDNVANKLGRGGQAPATGAINPELDQQKIFEHPPTCCEPCKGARAHPYGRRPVLDSSSLNLFFISPAS
jgi:predicted ATPase